MRRQSAVEALDILDTPEEERFERLARIARNIFKVPVVLITFMDGERQWFKTHLPSLLSFRVDCRPVAGAPYIFPKAG